MRSDNLVPQWFEGPQIRIPNSDAGSRCSSTRPAPGMRPKESLLSEIIEVYALKVLGDAFWTLDVLGFARERLELVPRVLRCSPSCATLWWSACCSYVALVGHLLFRCQGLLQWSLLPSDARASSHFSTGLSLPQVMAPSVRWRAGPRCAHAHIAETICRDQKAGTRGSCNRKASFAPTELAKKCCSTGLHTTRYSH